ncbi:MerR family transcriptional regulator [Ideonella sp. DXS29W]|uniref:MerR family transcriptional regulator n=1 Tax=Ideonella lacteola TaxID=2984193 RepID=A0ABU9BP60_9BURK
MSTSPPTPPLLSIADVERDTGLGKDTLRVWERRYGFPTPARDDQGQRMYTQADVDRLRQIAALLRAGHRPGRVVVLDDAQRQALLNPYPPGEGTDAPPNANGHGREAAAVQALLDTVTHRDGLALRRQLQQSLTRLGLAVFVTDLMAPLTTAVGQAWLRGELGVADEHLFTEVAHGILRQGLMSLPEPVPGVAPRVLLTTLPGEPHGLGLLMAEAMCALSGAWCVNLGPQTPIDEIVAAAGWHRAQVVGLSATGCLPVRWLRQGLDQLRQRLPAGTLLWLGGSAGDLRRAPGIVRITDLRAIAPAIAALPPPSGSAGASDAAGAAGR